VLAFGRAIFSEKTAGLKAPRIGRRRLRRMRAMDRGAAAYFGGIFCRPSELV
jgi:hypothetical protein